MNKPSQSHEGDALLFEWSEAGRRLRFENHRETAGAFRAEIWAEYQDDFGDWGVLYWGNHSLADPRSRQDMATATVRKDTGQFNWAHAIDTGCFLAVREWRRGEPVVDLSTISAPAQQEYLLWPFLPKNETTVLFGDGGAGKSWFGAVLGLSVLTGQKVPHCSEATQRGSVLYLDYETTDKEQRRRVESLLTSWSGFPLGFHHRACYRPIIDDVPFLKAEIQRLNVQLVIIDSLAPACGDDVAKPGVAVAAMNAIRSLDVTRLALGHITKDAAANSGTSQQGTIFGSIFFRNLARNTWEMRGESTEGINEVALYHRKVNNGPLMRKPLGYTFYFGEESVEIKGTDITNESTLAGTLPVPARVRDALRHGPLTLVELAEKADVDEHYLRTALGRMRDVTNLNQDRGRGAVGRYALFAPEALAPKASRFQCQRCFMFKNANELAGYEKSDNAPYCNVCACIKEESAS